MISIILLSLFLLFCGLERGWGNELSNAVEIVNNQLSPFNTVLILQSALHRMSLEACAGQMWGTDLEGKQAGMVNAGLAEGSGLAEGEDDWLSQVVGKKKGKLVGFPVLKRSQIEMLHSISRRMR